MDIPNQPTERIFHMASQCIYGIVCEFVLNYFLRGCDN